MMLCKMFLQPLYKRHDLMFCESKPMSFHPMPYNIHTIVNIVLSVNGVCTLVDVVIVDLIQVDLVSHVVFSYGVTAIAAVQAKEGFYHDQFLMDMFVPLAMEVFGCLH